MSPLVMRGFHVLLIALLVLATALAASESSDAPLARSNKEQNAAKDQLQVGLAYEQSGRFAEAETAYLKAINDGEEDTRRAAATALYRVIRLRAETASEAQLKLGESLERAGRLVDAEAAYTKLLDSGSPQMRSEALRRLDAVISRRQDVGPGLQMKLGDIYARDRRFADAEGAYAKVLENGSVEMRTEALRQMTAVVKRREGFYETQLRPILDGLLKVVIATVIVLIAASVFRPLFKWWGRRLYRNSLAISGFERTSGVHEIGSAFGETLRAMYDQITVHLRPRSVLATQKATMPSLIRSEASEFVELVAAASPSAGPFAKWAAGILRQPAFRITGSTESTWRQIKVLAKLEHGGTTLAQWSKTYSPASWFVAEQDLAYEILLTLKEYTDAHAS